MPTYKLYYFHARGFGEIIRLLFAQAGVEYEDIRFEKEQWPAHKPSKLTAESIEVSVIHVWVRSIRSGQVVVLTAPFTNMDYRDFNPKMDE